MKIKFSMEVECWNEDFTEYFLTFKYYDVVIDFDMWLDGMELMTEWYSIEMGRAEVSSDIVDNLERTHANHRITQFFNYAFDMIIPWANDYRPYGVSYIPIPETFNDLIKIKHLKMSVRDNYFSFTLDPEFLIKATAEERRQHMYVLASKTKGLNLQEHGLELLKALFMQ